MNFLSETLLIRACDQSVPIIDLKTFTGFIFLLVSTHFLMCPQNTEGTMDTRSRIKASAAVRKQIINRTVTWRVSDVVNS